MDAARAVAVEGGERSRPLHRFAAKPRRAPRRRDDAGDAAAQPSARPEDGAPPRGVPRRHAELSAVRPAMNAAVPAAVAGIGQTKYAKNMGRTEFDLACEAIRAACDDAGIDVGQIDGFVSYHIEQVAEVDLVTALGIPELRLMARTPSGGGGAASILGLAALAVEHGVAESVIA